MTTTQDFIINYRVSEHYYMKNDEQRIMRQLYVDNELIATEDYFSGSSRGELGQLTKQMSQIANTILTSDCSNCRYKVGDYRGDPGYLLYILFKTRLRIKFLKFKMRFFRSTTGTNN